MEPDPSTPSTSSTIDPAIARCCPDRRSSTASPSAGPGIETMLCVGLDPEPKRFPPHLRGSAAILDFCRAIVDATHDLVCAFKPQIAYFAANRAEDQLEALIAYIHERHPDVPVILDAKRGDMGATSEQYAREVFERYRADAVTLQPYLGLRRRSLPYLAYPGKRRDPAVPDVECERRRAAGAAGRVRWRPARTAVPARRAPGGRANGTTSGQCGLVVGATYPRELAAVRAVVGRTYRSWFPASGRRAATSRPRSSRARRTAGGLMVSSSRAVLYAGQRRGRSLRRVASRRGGDARRDRGGAPPAGRRRTRLIAGSAEEVAERVEQQRPASSSGMKCPAASARPVTAASHFACQSAIGSNSLPTTPRSPHTTCIGQRTRSPGRVTRRGRARDRCRPTRGSPRSPRAVPRASSSSVRIRRWPPARTPRAPRRPSRRGTRATASARPTPSIVSGSGDGWVRKNQCQYACANAKSVRSYIVSVGEMSITHRRSTAARMIEREPMGDPSAAVVADQHEAVVAEHLASRRSRSAAIARFA